MRLILSLAVLAATVPGLAHAGKCGKHDELFSEIYQQYHEVHVLDGIVKDGKATMELWVSSEGTWTVAMRNPDDLTCIILYGSDIMQSGDVPPLGGRTNY